MNSVLKNNIFIIKHLNYKNKMGCCENCDGVYYNNL